MSIQFGPLYGLPILLSAETSHIAPCECRWPSGWWLLPSMIVGAVECVAIIGWIVA